MKIIDILKYIANERIDKLPSKIKYDEKEYNLLVEYKYENNRYYITYAEDNLSEDVYGELLFDTYNLNDKVEIIDKANWWLNAR